MLEWLDLPVAASAHAGDVDRIMSLVHWLMFVLFVGWSLFFVFVLVRFRRRRHPTANYHGVKARWASWVEGGVLAAEVALLVFFSIPTWSARVDALPPERGSTVVRVVAEQFAWNVHYPGADGVFGPTSISLVNPDNPLGLDRRDPAGRDDITTINRLNLPVGRPVIVYLVIQGRRAQLRSPANADQAGRDAWRGSAGLVHPHTNGRVGHRLCAVVRPRSLPHAGDVRDPVAGAVRCLAGERSDLPDAISSGSVR